MSAVTTHPYVESLLAGYESPRGGASWLNERRAHALERANALSVPTTREEEWRFTDLSLLTRVNFKPAAGAPQLKMGDIAGVVAKEACARLVFVDGTYAPALSAADGLPQGVTVTTLAAALGTHNTVESHLARHAAFEHDVFTALNTAHLRDGALIHVARNRKCPAPVQVVYVSTQKEVAVYPRCLVIAEAGSECVLVEDYISLGGAVYFNDAVAEVVVGEGARVDHVRVQNESADAFHIAACSAMLAKDARYASRTVTFGARLSRLNLAVVQQGDGVETAIDGLALLSARQLADTHTLMDHARPHGRCRQEHKLIVDGGAHAVFNGKILVRPGAQLTDSSQQSRALLLSGKAQVDAKPQLEIFADDVKCAHGAAIGQLDPEHLFYLRSRGIPEAQARRLLTYAFAAELIERIPVLSVVERLERAVLAQTQAG